MKHRTPYSTGRRKRAAFGSRLNPVRGFTLLELLVACVILAFIMVLTNNILRGFVETWVRGNARVNQFREAREAFERISSSLAQATLNPYLAYRYNNSSTPTIPASIEEAPTDYRRHSELQFVTGPSATLFNGGNEIVEGSHAIFFQAPLGFTREHSLKNLDKLLCGTGYFVLFCDDSNYLPPHVTRSKRRFRLMEYRPPAERNRVYSEDPGKWFSDAVGESVSNESSSSSGSTRPAAENIVLLLFSPRGRSLGSSNPKLSTGIAPNYEYDSAAIANVTTEFPQGTEHLLPEEITITLVAIDEASAGRLEARYGSQPPSLIPTGAFTKADQYENDLALFEERLKEERLTYQVFTRTIALRNARWELF